MTTQYLILDHVRKAMGIKSDNNIEAIKEVIFDANIEVDKALKPYADNIPLPPEDERTEFDVEVFERGRSLALAFVRARWYSYTGQIDWSESYQKEYDDKLASLVQVFRARRGSRTKRVVRTTRPRARRMYSQVKRF